MLYQIRVLTTVCYCKTNIYFFSQNILNIKTIDLNSRRPGALYPQFQQFSINKCIYFGFSA